MDIRDLREPVEIFEAAAGKPERLVALLRSDEPLTRRMREALALLVAGDLDFSLGRNLPLGRKRVQDGD